MHKIDRENKVRQRTASAPSLLLLGAQGDRHGGGGEHVCEQQAQRHGRAKGPRLEVKRTNRDVDDA